MEAIDRISNLTIDGKTIDESLGITISDVRNKSCTIEEAKVIIDAFTQINKNHKNIIKAKLAIDTINISRPDVIKWLLVNTDRNQSEIARFLGVTQPLISQYANGK